MTELDNGRVVFGSSKTAEEVDEAVDPACGMTVNKFDTPHRTIYGGKPFFFCSAACEAKFVEQPSRYLPTE